MAVDHWPIHECIRALRRAYLFTGRQACLRVTAQSRRDGDRVHTLVLLRASALSHWPLPPLWVSCIFEDFPVCGFPASSKTFQFTDAQILFAQQSRLRNLFLLVFSKRVSAFAILAARRDCAQPAPPLALQVWYQQTTPKGQGLYQRNHHYSLHT